METKIYAIYDDTAKALVMLFLSPNPMTAVRTFNSAVMGKQWGEATKDMILYEVGSIEKESVQIKVEKPYIIDKASNYKPEEKK